MNGDKNFKAVQLRDAGRLLMLEKMRGVVDELKEAGVSLSSVIAALDELSDFYCFERRLHWHDEMRLSALEEKKLKEMQEKLDATAKRAKSKSAKLRMGKKK